MNLQKMILTFGVKAEIIEQLSKENGRFGESSHERRKERKTFIQPNFSSKKLLSSQNYIDFCPFINQFK